MSFMAAHEMVLNPCADGHREHRLEKDIADDPHDVLLEARADPEEKENDDRDQEEICDGLLEQKRPDKERLGVHAH
jgi:hypothetical protein